ncbi:TonB-dependent receptor [Porphyromonas crevioricanis]|uniref:TonB-dependent receptor n=1 Tax=Porphyromonas crevioricanis TaxID=393921 RepID=A0AB34PG78_9PORP|nr:TonB-dependent receptor [Porphyromonas crevioricanis]KGN95389.1 TonB-dependent receptor [Porphyromonas crevioricanis]
MKQSKFLRPSLLSLGLALGVSASAQSVPDSSRIVQLEEVQVVAGRAGYRTPVSFSEMKKSELKRSAYGQDMPYLLSLLPGVVATSDAGTGLGYTSLKVRGSDASRINITTNGVPLNDSESQGVFWVNMPDFSSSLRDVQVQRGLGTSSNGAAAFGATINMRTEQYGLTPYAQVDLSGGAFGTFRRSASIGSGALSNGWAFDARISKITSDGFVKRADVDLNSYFFQSAYHHNGTLLKLITFGGKEKTGIAWNGIDPNKMDKLGRDYNSAGFMYKDAEGKEHLYHNTDNYNQRHYQAILSQQLGDRWSLNATLHATRGLGYTDEYRTGRKLKEYALKPFELEGNKIKKTDLIRQKHLDNWFYGLITSAQYRAESYDLTFGASANAYDGKHFGYINWIKQYSSPLEPEYRYYDNKSDKKEASAFAKINWQPVSGLNLFADLQYRGIRYKMEGVDDKYSDTDKRMATLDIEQSFNFFNPKAGVSYSLVDGHVVYASVAMGHREPNRKAYTDAGSKGFPTEEKMIDYELGYRWQLPSFAAAVNFYYMDYKDQLVLDGRFSDVGELLFSNVPNSYRMGVELSAGWEPCEYFTWNIAAAFSRNKIDKYTQTFAVYGPGDDDFELRTEEMKNTDISYSPSVVLSNLFTTRYKGLELGLQTQYVGKQYLDNTMNEDRSLKAYCVSALRLGYRLPVSWVEDFSLGLTVNNLFNTEYSSNAYVYDTGYVKGEDGKLTAYNDLRVFPQAPIHLMGSVSIRF